MFILLDVAICLCFSIAGVLDWRERVVPDWIPAAAFLVSVTRMLLSGTAAPLLGLLIPIFCYLAFYRRGAMGGADIKMLCALCTYQSLPETLLILLLATGMAILSVPCVKKWGAAAQRKAYADNSIPLCTWFACVMIAFRVAALARAL